MNMYIIYINMYIDMHMHIHGVFKYTYGTFMSPGTAKQCTGNWAAEIIPKGAVSEAFASTEGPSTQYLRLPVPKTILLMVVGTRDLKHWYLDPLGSLFQALICQRRLCVHRLPVIGNEPMAHVSPSVDPPETNCRSRTRKQ